MSQIVYTFLVMRCRLLSTFQMHSVSLVPKPVLELERGQFIVAPPPGHDRRINNRRINNKRTMAIPPSALKVLVNLPVAAEWRRLGGQLGVPEFKLDEIQANHEHSHNAAITVMPHPSRLVEGGA